MTPLAAEANDLRRREAEARGDAELIEKSFDELSERAWWDQEEANGHLSIICGQVSALSFFENRFATLFH